MNPLASQRLHPTFARVLPPLKYALAFALLLFFSSTSTQAQLVVNSGFTGQQLADTLSGRGVAISNVALNCAGGASGIFDGTGSNIGIDKGVLLTTGNVNNAVGPNFSINDFGSQNAGTNDPILDFLSGGSTDDACALEFDITADCDIIQIAYVFASEEYPQFVNANFNDIFGFFVSGPGIPPGGTNIALIPGTTTPVSIDNVNAVTNNGYFVNNPTGGATTIKYNGFTTPLLALIKVEPCLTYRIKLVIADGGDDTYDSGVFLDLGGIRCFQNRTAAYANYDISGVDYAVEGCNELSLDIVRTGDSTNAKTVDFLLAGTATNGSDYLSIPGNLTFPALQDSITINLNIPDDGIIEGMEFIELIIRDSICNTVTRDTLTIRIFDPASVVPGADTSICVNASLALPAQYSDSSGTISWTPTANLNDPTLLSPIFTPPTAGNYQFIVQLTDSIGCMDQDTIVVTVTPFALAQASQDVPCFGDSTGSLTATVNGTSPYRFIWKDNAQTILVDSTQSGGSQILNNLPAGNYTVVITDAQGCTDSLTYVINQPAAALNASLTAQTNVDCNGANTGSATLAATDGTPPYQYSSDGVNFGSNPILGTLSAGTYSLVVRDANNCLFTVNATITEPPALVPSILSQINVDCNGNATGSVDILASGGTMPYQYSIDATNFSPSTNFGGLAAGNYTITIRDANNCLATQAVVITQATVLNLNLASQTNVDCNGNSTGSVTLIGAGGTAPYQYASDGITFTANTTFAGLGAGAYTFTVRDDSSCTASLNVTITEPNVLGAVIGSQTNVDCNGNSTGSVSLTPNGGTTPYQFSIDGINFSTSNQFTGLAVGAYTFSVRDANNCLFSLNATITEPPVLSATLVNQINVDCFGASTGSAELSSTGGTSPYQYSSNGVNFGNSPILTGLSAGTYSLSVRDANNCLFSLSVTITEPPILTTSILSQNNVDCNGNSTGIVNIGAAGGTPPYQYAINGGAFSANPTFTTLAAGSYTASVRDANNCLQNQAITISEPSVLNLNLVSQSNVDCNGNSVGAIVVIGQGGTVSYQYSIDGVNFANANTFGGLAAGTYTLSVRDDSSCLATLNVTITEPTPLNASIANQVNVDCNGNSTGSLSLTPNGGTTPYQFSIDGINFSTSNQFNNLAAGTYNLSVRDANNCLFSLNATITEPNVLGGDFSNIINVDCFGSSNGSLTISGTGGTAPYAYALNGAAPQTNGTFNNLFAGVYTLTITDAQACVATRDTSIVTPTGLTGGIDSVVNLLCNGAGTGSAAAFATGGATPYTYSLDGVNFQNSSSFTGLPAGADTITVRDNNACIFRIPFVLTEPAILQVQVLQNNGVLCFGDSTAILILGGTGGTGSYQYQINGQGYQTSSTFSQLPAGNYTVEIQDQNLCVNSSSISVTEPPLLSLSIDSRQDVACFGGSSGAFSVAPMGGVGPYTYAINGGPFTNQTNFLGLSAGFYYVFVEDANNCQDSTSITITEPTALTANIDVQKDVSCFGESNGWVRILPLGGTPNYQYSLDGITYQPSNQITGLSAGSYTVRIQDDSACVFNLPVQINQPTQLGSSILVQKDVDCFGNSTGAVTLSGTGGITPYLYDFNAAGLQSGNSFTGLVAGSYTVIIQDDSLCRDTSSVLIIEPTILSLAVDTVMDVACFGDSTGSVQLLTTGGSGTYRYLLSNGDTANVPQFTGLPAGNYTANVTDDSSCVASVNFVVNEPPLLVGSIAYQQNVDCNGNATGDVGILASGGTPPYQYAINGGPFSTDSNFVGLIAGPYVVEIQDQLGCSFLVNVTISEPAPLVPSINSLLNIDCFGNATGEADILASGGTPPYTFSIDSLNFQASGVFTGLLAGPHSVWVRDDSSCITRIDFQLTQPDTLIMTLDSLVNVDCNGNATAYIEASAVGGTLAYLYSLDGGVLQSSGRFENLTAGNYQLVLSDAQGCSDTMQIQITEPAVLSLTTSNTDVICYSEANGTASVVPQGGTPPYQIQWDNRQDSLTAINLIAGVYKVTVTDNQGCETQAFQAVGQPDTLILSLVQKEDAFCSWENGSVTVAASGGITSVYQYDWNTNPAQFQAAITGVGTGTYIAMATDQNGCTDTLSMFIGDTPPATPDFMTIPTLADSILLSEANIQFNNLSTGAVSYQWEFGDGNASVLQNPKHTYVETGVYTIKLTAYNEFFVCPAIIEKEIHIIPDGIVYIPTAFSPNDDGQNDAFLVKGEGIVSLSVVIYNRWGRQVGRLNAPGDRWDGRLTDGSAAPEGVYTFSAQAIFNSGKILKRGGTVTLIR